MAGEIFRDLFDDASLFPPASLAMADAVASHLRHQAAWYRDMSGPFVCADGKLTALAAVLDAANVAELDLALVLPGGAAQLDAAVDAVFADPRLLLRAVELPVGPADQPGDDAAAVAELADRLDATPLAGAAAFIEIPLARLSAAATEAAAEHLCMIKLRTGGTTAEAFPDEHALARGLALLADQRQPFKCTAGLHHAVRHRAADTGFEHHGFLNVLLAVAAAADGADPVQIAAVLAEQDAAKVSDAVGRLSPDQVAQVRGLFVSFGTCSTDEPVTDLVTLGLVHGDQPGSATGS
jgi:hypothetical protein